MRSGSLGKLGSLMVASGAAALVVSAVACNAVIDIGDIDFADTVANGGSGSDGGSSTTTTTGTGGSGGEGLQGGGGSGGEAAGTPGGEFCINGIDDDGDGDVDCADTDCTAFECMPEAPAPWEGPAVIYLGEGGEPLPACAGAWGAETDLGEDINVPTHSCSSCTCGSASGGACTMSTLSDYGTPTCGGVPLAYTPLGDGNCDSYTPLSTNGGLRASAVTVSSSGSCSPSGGTVSAPAISWDTEGRLCSSHPDTAAGCGTGTVCAPAPVAPFGAAICIFQAGSHTCPTEFPVPSIMYSSYSDSRDCSNCSCGSASGQTCNGNIAVRPGTSCTGPPTNVTSGAGCVPFSYTPPPTTAVYEYSYSLSGGSCSASGGTPTGTATAQDQVTICCTDTP